MNVYLTRKGLIKIKDLFCKSILTKEGSSSNTASVERQSNNKNTKNSENCIKMWKMYVSEVSTSLNMSKFLKI